MNIVPQLVIKKEFPVPENYEGRTVKGHTIINIPDWLSEEYSNLMDHVDGMDYYVRIQTEGEFGGKKGVTGNAGIISDLCGNPLKNSFIVKNGPYENAMVYVITRKPYIHVSAHVDGDYVILHVKEIIPKLPFYNFESLWKFDGLLPGIQCKIPDKCIKYTKVIMATLKKSQCEDCHCLQFYGSNQHCAKK